MAVIIQEEVKRQPWMSDQEFEWAQQEEKARCNTLLRKTLGRRKAILAIKAQHPLRSDGTPGAEYTARLRKALEVKQKLEADNFQVTLMTFGGIHAGHNTISLAEAGAQWLIEHKVDPTDILIRSAIYSGNDEDDTAIVEFENDQYAELHIVLSAGQVARTYLFCVAMGWIPTLHAISFIDSKPHHSMVCEIWGTWPGSLNDFRNNGTKALQSATEAIRKRHLEEAEESQTH